MKILMRSDQSKEWKVAGSIRTKGEAELQNLLIESPFLIPINEIREGISPLVFAVKEFGLPGSGNTDILAFSSEGDITIVECKLAVNSESKRTVIGQILEYAAFLWGMDYEEVSNRVQRLKARKLIDLIEDAVAGEWDKEGFLNGIKQTLKNGSFVLIIVVDEINEELRRIIKYINECSESAFSLHALELNRFQADKVEVLVPHLYGLSDKPSAGGRKRKQWTEEEFFKVLKENAKPKIAKVVRDLYEWGRNIADRIWFGTGAATGSFTFHYLAEGKTISIFSIYTDGKLYLNYGALSPRIDKEMMKEFHKKIHEIPTFRRISDDFSKYPSIEIVQAFKDSEAIDKFKQAIAWIKEKLP